MALLIWLGKTLCVSRRLRVFECRVSERSVVDASYIRLALLLDERRLDTSPMSSKYIHFFIKPTNCCKLTFAVTVRNGQ
jgi:hypothetical protein